MPYIIRCRKKKKAAFPTQKATAGYTAPIFFIVPQSKRKVNPFLQKICIFSTKIKGKIIEKNFKKGVDKRTVPCYTKYTKRERERR